MLPWHQKVHPRCMCLNDIPQAVDRAHKEININNVRQPCTCTKLDGCIERYLLSCYSAKDGANASLRMQLIIHVKICKGLCSSLNTCILL